MLFSKSLYKPALGERQTGEELLLKNCLSLLKRRKTVCLKLLYLKVHVNNVHNMQRVKGYTLSERKLH